MRCCTREDKRATAVETTQCWHVVRRASHRARAATPCLQKILGACFSIARTTGTQVETFATVREWTTRTSADVTEGLCRES